MELAANPADRIPFPSHKPQPRAKVMNNHAANLSPLDMLRYEQRRKSRLAAYLWWAFLGGTGAHRFYVGSPAMALLILACTIVSFAFLPALIVTLIIQVIDLFMIPSLVRAYNVRQLTAVASGEINP